MSAPGGGAGGAGGGGAPTEEGLQPQELVITLLGTYVRQSGRTVWSGGLVVLLGELGFSQGAARVALTRLVRRGLIARERSGRLVHYRVTERCDRLLADGDGRIFSLGNPRDDGGSWAVLWHQIPEDRRLERSRLARRLRFLGFGSVQDSVWVSPHDHSDEVSRLHCELGVSAVATLFVARAGAVEGLPALVARGLADAEAFRVRTRMVHLFRGFPFVDPELPDQLAAVSRARSHAVPTFHPLYTGLAAASQRHFDLVTGGYERARMPLHQGGSTDESG